ncbi:hypothetical protein L6164_007358 [Bauhinia variegata]|uniref:Uncharacterized protein n=1 Tax=Bauhinia variegata TaxID=167791 RepID=A0ACB9PEQ8_BAUVA|nr:hypothetical protein L6164_007358 [Bauhinia variegata]
MAVFIGPDSSTLLPGFRFNPTDHELVRFYLKLKVCRKFLRLDPIGEIDIYKFVPLDLRGVWKLKSKDLKWYFYATLDRKYANSSRTNRATDRGYWKTTGKDRPVFEGSRNFGMKNTLVYHYGRAPNGCFLLYRLFQKSGAGPRNGEQYCAPFREEEWKDLEAVAAPPANDAGEEAVIIGDSVSVSVEVNNLRIMK